MSMKPTKKAGKTARKSTDPTAADMSAADATVATLLARHEPGAAYMALGAALATGRPQTYAVAPGPCAREAPPHSPGCEPTLVEVPIGEMSSPWEFIQMPQVRGGWKRRARMTVKTIAIAPQDWVK